MNKLIDLNAPYTDYFVRLYKGKESEYPQDIDNLVNAFKCGVHTSTGEPPLFFCREPCLRMDTLLCNLNRKEYTSLYRVRPQAERGRRLHRLTLPLISLKYV